MIYRFSPPRYMCFPWVIGNKQEQNKKRGCWSLLVSNRGKHNTVWRPRLDWWYRGVLQMSSPPEIFAVIVSLLTPIMRNVDAFIENESSTTLSQFSRTYNKTTSKCSPKQTHGISRSLSIRLVFLLSFLFLFGIIKIKTLMLSQKHLAHLSPACFVREIFIALKNIKLVLFWPGRSEQIQMEGFSSFINEMYILLCYIYWWSIKTIASEIKSVGSESWWFSTEQLHEFGLINSPFWSSSIK